MPPVIRIPEETFKRLQKHAVPFEDTPASVIDRLLGFFESHSSMPITAEMIPKGNEKTASARGSSVSEIAAEAVKALGLTPRATVDLTHSKIVKARFGDLSANDWAELNKLAHRKAFDALGSLEALQKKVSWEIPKGKRRDKGFRYGYIKDLGFSVRGVDANTSWERSQELARLCRLPISVTAIGADKKQIMLEWVPPNSD